MTTTKRCPKCGDEYLTGVERCFDCDVALVEVPDDDLVDADELVDADLVDADILGGEGAGRIAPLASGPTEAHDDDDDGDEDDEIGTLSEDREQVEYHLHEWSAEFRAMLQQLVAGAGVAHVWEGATMVVAAADEARVDELVEQVEMTEEVSLDPLAEKTVYEVSDWSMDQLTVLLDALGQAGIPHEFDIEGDLAVLAEDEERVEALLDTLEFATPESATDAGEGDPDDGIETAEILSDLFVACDRLQNDATDHSGVLGGVDAVNRLENRPLPFGFGPALWQDIIAKARSLRDDIEDDSVDDLDLMDHARDLRTLLRHYV